MVPAQRLVLEGDEREDGEHEERDHLLDDLQLHQCEGAAVPDKTDPVGGNHEGVFEKGDPPGKENDRVERPTADQLGALKFQVGVPGERHEDVRDEKKTNGGKAFSKHDGGRAQTERL